eukprot:TRINITY_DN2856_c0_g2_i1.p1 TRINITY_DN2856_c0_g2~~TRINITY_DN2856_c0_g2_i1.p1  ORF type:complete len:389 (+),score=30.93 TRINITY_DN2856_c0_g2_i1:64-1167(+)
MSSYVNTALIWAALGGCCWGVGPLAKKIGIATVKDKEWLAWSCFTSLTYATGSIVLPLMSVAYVDTASRNMVWHDEKWRGSIPWLIVGAVCSAIAGAVSVYAFTCASPNYNCLVATIESGCYSVISTLFIVLLLGEALTFYVCLAGFFMVVGMVLMHVSPTTHTSDAIEMKDSATPSTEADVAGDKGTENYGSVDSGKRTDASSESHDASNVKAFMFALLAAFLWSIGIVAKRRSALLIPTGYKEAGAAVTYGVYQIAGAPVQIMLAGGVWMRSNVAHSDVISWLRARALLVLTLGLVSGIGGVLSTYALTYKNANGVLLSLTVDGMYVMFGSLLLAAVYLERPSVLQTAGCIVILVGVLVSHIKPA